MVHIIHGSIYLAVNNSSVPNGAKPTVPSRASKPQMSPLRALPSVPSTHGGSGKAPPPAPPSPPPLVSKSYPGSPVKKV